jgi:hypothetical protein
MITKGRPPEYKPPTVVNFPKLPDSVLVDNLVDRGEVPRRIAREWMGSPQMIVSAQYFYFDVLDADKGDKEAKERVDYFREQMSLMKSAEKALGNDPEVKVVPFKLPSGQEVFVEGDVVKTRPMVEPIKPCS